MWFNEYNYLPKLGRFNIFYTRRYHISQSPRLRWFFLILKKITEEVYFMLVRVGQKREDVRVRVD